MAEKLDDGDTERSGHEKPARRRGTNALLTDYSVVSPGVEIVLDGRAVSARSAD